MHDGTSNLFIVALIHSGFEQEPLGELMLTVYENSPLELGICCPKGCLLYNQQSGTYIRGCLRWSGRNPGDCIEDLIKKYVFFFCRVRDPHQDTVRRREEMVHMGYYCLSSEGNS